MADLKSRPIGAKASLGRAGYPTILSATGGELEIVTGASQPGFNPLDLLLAALAACMSMSARVAARELGFAHGFEGIDVEVNGVKAQDTPSRFIAYTVHFNFHGSLTAQEQHTIAHRAEEICTVSNSLAVRPTVTTGSG